MDNRNAILNRYAAGMADIWLSRTQLTSKVILIFNEVTRDHYQDAIHTETQRVMKLAAVKKNADMNYVQELFGEILLEDNLEQLPWVVSLTMTCLPRVPKMDDQIIINGLKYTISMVSPKNRNLTSLLSLLIYPERAERALESNSFDYSFNSSFAVHSLNSGADFNKSFSKSFKL